MLAETFSAALSGIEALPVQVEVNTDLEGEPKLGVVGLPDASVKESQERVHSAIINSGFRIPYTRTTINLAPGDLRKEGPAFDLPMAVGILSATDQLKNEIPSDMVFAGELSLSGNTRAIKGGLPIALMAKRLGFKKVVLPFASAQEAALVEEVEVYPVESLSQTVRFLDGELPIDPLRPSVSLQNQNDLTHLDFADIKGQFAAKRAIEIAVAGSHNILLIGPPGCGKSMIAKRIPSIMPEPTMEEYLEILSIHSSAGVSLAEGFKMERPFRAPHHTISDVGLLGGGSIPGPGEISLAHNGVLFLDELPEFRRSTLEVLRQPLEDAKVSISRSKGKLTLPCSFMLVAAMNPTPCGGDSRSGQPIRSTPAQIQKYRSKISGPLLDRIDIHIEVPALSIQELRNTREGEPSLSIRSRIEIARIIQQRRFMNTGVFSNARMGQKDLKTHCHIHEHDGLMLEHAMEELNLSARAYDRILRVARTIADLAESDMIKNHHLMEAIQYRSLDRTIFH